MEEYIQNYSMIALRGMIVYPYITHSFEIGRLQSQNALKSAVDNNQGYIFLSPQKNISQSLAKFEDTIGVGTVAKIKQIIKLPNDNNRVVVQGIFRAKPVENLSSQDMLAVRIEKTEDTANEIEAEGCKRAIIEILKEYAKFDPKVTADQIAFFSQLDIVEFCYTVANMLLTKHDQRQKVLEIDDLLEREKYLLQTLCSEIEIIKVEREISQKVKKAIDASQKEYYLREQIKAISEELGDSSDEIIRYQEKIKALKIPDKTSEEKILKEVSRLLKMQAASPETTVIRNYADTILDLPWSFKTKDNKNLKKARQILDEDHYGLEKVKERIIEYLAVCSLSKKIKGPILCFAGPPGVGKTSIAKSIARAVGRNYVRMSLGGVRDEAEIRGHRKTYIGAICGRILYNMKLAKSINPVFLLDEIDKMSSDFRGDPSSAMLEVLDPEQNNTFRDHYVEVPYDLSKVMFITTANNMESIPAPLLDRMEIIQLTGYADEEKIEIAKRHLICKQEEQNGLKKGTVKISDQIFQKIIEGYTKESGVRTLEREIGSICRKIAAQIVDGDKRNEFVLNEKNLLEYLGQPKYLGDENRAVAEIGAVTGLAYTTVGGVTLTVEVALYKGKGEILLTGSLGDVMKESARAAFSVIKSRAEKYGIDKTLIEQNDIHIHVPAGATPKDGPSAGITIATAIYSAFTKKKIDANVAMTGEITLRGKVLAIGGLKEKILAAFRNGTKTVIIPESNQKDLEEISEKVKNQISFVLAKDIDDGLNVAVLKSDVEG